MFAYNHSFVRLVYFQISWAYLLLLVSLGQNLSFPSLTLLLLNSFFILRFFKILSKAHLSVKPHLSFRSQVRLGERGSFLL
ncbi:hypothetical protein A3H19_06245 [Candidatus Woesebacteria bacterium RIFCSPLOWO2_12_FULL_39_9]|nr:MAG: hypothetical protein A3H19_06245 [Candidatus Woesebacteria bacterium RIFCSPLOWO2_12_FULL_39_9]